MSLNTRILLGAATGILLGFIFARLGPEAARPHRVTYRKLTRG